MKPLFWLENKIAFVMEFTLESTGARERAQEKESLFLTVFSATACCGRCCSCYCDELGIFRATQRKEVTWDAGGGAVLFGNGHYLTSHRLIVLSKALGTPV